MDKVMSFQLPSDNFEISKDFYAKVFSWQVAEVPVEMDGGKGIYTTITTTKVDPSTFQPIETGAINGAIIGRAGKLSGPIIIANVASIDRTFEKVADVGGTIIEPKREINKMGFYAYVADPEGNVIGLWEDVAK
jgi:predicted enzyme related to lactoylglutathione lyase